MLGLALAALHRVPAGRVGDLPPGFDPMWGLSLSEPLHERLLDLSAGALDLVGRLQASRALCDRLDALRDAVSGDVVMHGDLRWENCLAVAAPGSLRRTRVLLVDWELAGPGPAGFDAGTVLAEYLLSWVGSIPIVDPVEPGRPYRITVSSRLADGFNRFDVIVAGRDRIGGPDETAAFEAYLSPSLTGDPVMPPARNRITVAP